MRTSPLVLATLTLAALCALVSCSSPDEPSDNDGATSAANGGGTDSSGISAGDAEDSTSGGSDGRDSVRNQAIAAQVDHALREGQAAINKGDFEGARTLLQGAMQADPGNTEIEVLLDRIALQLGERSGEISVLRQSAEERDAVRRKQAQVEIENKLRESERARREGDLDRAIQTMETALLIFRWNPYVDVGGADASGLTEAQVRERLSALRTEKDESEREARTRRAQLALAEQEEKERQEQERASQLVSNLLRKANDSFYAERYREAETFAQKVVSLDPDNEPALELASIASDAHHAALQRQYRSEFRYHWREIFDDLEYDDLPQTDLLTFPSDRDWAKIDARGPLTFSVGAESISPEDQAIYDILNTQSIEIDFDGVTLEEAVDYLRVQTGANFILDSIVLDEAGDIEYTLTLPPMPVGNALGYLMDFADAEIKHMVADGVVKIVSTEEATGGQLLEFYDIRDITQLIESFPSRDFNLQPSGAFDDFEEPDLEPAPIVIDGEALSDLIQSNIAIDSWDADPNNTISVISGALVVRQTPDVHRQIDKLLTDLRGNAGTLINVETRFIEMEDRFLQDVGIDFRGLDGQNGSTATADVPIVILDDSGVPGGGGVGSPGFPQGIGGGNDAGAFFTNSDDLDLRGRLENLYDLGLGDEDFQGTGGLALEFTYLDDTALEAVLRAVEKTSMAEIITSQNLTVFNGQRANIIAQDHISYLSDFEVEIAQGAVVADPVISVLRDGTILDVRPVVSADRRFVTMEVRPTVTNLVEPIATFRTSLSVGNEVELFLPELEVQRVRTTVTIPDGATLMLGGMKTMRESLQVSGMPFLRDLPLINFLTTSKATEHSRQKLLILVRASVIIPEELEGTP